MFKGLTSFLYNYLVYLLKKITVYLVFHNVGHHLVICRA